MRRVPSWTGGMRSYRAGRVPAAMAQTLRTSNRAMGTQNKPKSHYKVRLDGVWADVPDEAVVTEPNRDGRTLVWYYDSWTGHSGKPGKVIKCFMPGTMT